MPYEHGTFLQPAADVPVLNDMLGALGRAGVEGCTSQHFRIPFWPEGTVLVRAADGSVDMAKSPAPTHWGCEGFMNVEATAAMPEHEILPDEVIVTRSLPNAGKSRAGGAPDVKPTGIEKFKPVKAAKPNDMLDKIPNNDAKKPTPAKGKKALDALIAVKGKTAVDVRKAYGLISW